MKAIRGLLGVAVLLAGLAGCSKDDDALPESDQLIEALHAKDATAVTAIIKPILTSYNVTSFNQIRTQMTSSYGLTGVTVCFDCVKTLPGQTEIRVTYVRSAVSETRYIDVTPGPSNEMKIVAVHE